MAVIGRVLSIAAFALVLLLFVGNLFGGLIGNNNGFAHWLNPADQPEILVVLHALKQRDYAAVNHLMDASIHPTAGQIDAIAKLIPDAPYTGIKTVGAWSNWQFVPTHERRDTVALELSYPDSWLLVDAIIDTKDGRMSVYGFNVKPLDEPLEQSTRFFNADPDMPAIIALLVSIGIMGFVMYSAVVCLRSNIPRKPLWILLTAVGICQVAVNWSTSAFNITPIYFMIPAAMMHRASAFSPWLIVESVPAGAILFWVVYRGRLRDQRSEAAPVDVAAADDDADAAPAHR